MNNLLYIKLPTKPSIWKPILSLLSEDTEACPKSVNTFEDAK